MLICKCLILNGRLLELIWEGHSDSDASTKPTTNAPDFLKKQTLSPRYPYSGHAPSTKQLFQQNWRYDETYSHIQKIPAVQENGLVQRGFMRVWSLSAQPTHRQTLYAERKSGNVYPPKLSKRIISSSTPSEWRRSQTVFDIMGGPQR